MLARYCSVLTGALVVWFMLPASPTQAQAVGPVVYLEEILVTARRREKYDGNYYNRTRNTREDFEELTAWGIEFSARWE